MSVKRYDTAPYADSYDEPMRESDDGRYVLASDYDALCYEIQGKDSSIAHLDKQVEALRTDAERYRWLKDNPACSVRIEVSERSPDKKASPPEMRAALDSFIDKMRLSQPDSGEQA